MISISRTHCLILPNKWAHLIFFLETYLYFVSHAVGKPFYTNIKIYWMNTPTISTGREKNGNINNKRKTAGKNRIYGERTESIMIIAWNKTITPTKQEVWITCRKFEALWGKKKKTRVLWNSKNKVQLIILKGKLIFKVCFSRRWRIKC